MYLLMEKTHAVCEAMFSLGNRSKRDLIKLYWLNSYLDVLKRIRSSIYSVLSLVCVCTCVKDGKNMTVYTR